MLSLRTASVLRTLDRAQAAIDGVQTLDDQLGRRLAARFAVLAEPVREHFGGNGARDPAEDARFLARGETMVAETLAFLGGASARSFELDEGITALAQRWLDQLSDRAVLDPVAVVIPASTESAGMLTQVIRLRVPTHGVWGLPVAVHEYGHFVASELRRRDSVGGIPHQVSPVEQVLFQAGAGDEHRDGVPARYWHGHELFADAVATVVTGPAYLRYCLRYRFDPAAAFAEQDTHPPSDARVQMALAVLDDLADQDANGGYLQDEAGALRESWSASVAAAGKDAAAESPLAELATKILQLVRRSDELQRLRYRSHLFARALAERSDLGADGDTTVAHVLNAAWLRRERLESAEEDPSTAVAALGREAREAVEERLAHG